MKYGGANRNVGDGVPLWCVVSLLVAALGLAGCGAPASPGGSGTADTVCDGGPEDPAGGRVNDASYGAGSFAGVTIYPACAEHAEGTLMFVHGGGYTSGSRTDAGWASVQEWRKLGWVLVSIDYELSPFAVWPQHVGDVRKALSWWRDTGAQQYDSPAYPLVGIGWSAGGQLVEWTNLEDSGPHFDAAVSVGGSTWWPDRTDSDAAVALFGPPCCQLGGKLVQASTLTHLDQSDAPLLHVHGIDDGTVAVSQAELLSDAIASSGDSALHEVVLVDDCGHSPSCLGPERLGEFLDSLTGS